MVHMLNEIITTCALWNSSDQYMIKFNLIKKKPLVLHIMSVKTNKELELEKNKKLLELDFQSCHNRSDLKVRSEALKKGEFCVRCLGNRTQIKPWKDKYRYNLDWDDVNEKRLRGFNFFMTLNPDPSCDWYVHERDKKSIIPRYLEMIEYLKFRYIIKSSLSIYEYGKYGKKGGRIHFHALIKSDNKKELIQNVLKNFNNRTNMKHRTVQCRHLRSVEDRNYQFNIYMRKEEHNKDKLLFMN